MSDSSAGRLSVQSLATAYRLACYQELEALKPGNVHIYADGHGMTVGDFRRAADLSAPLLSDPQISCGMRILKAVERVMDNIGCNVNLGILLLAAPLLAAASRIHQFDQLPHAVKHVLTHLTPEDAQAVYAAIRRAHPGGLGESPLHDVHHRPKAPLQEAMMVAAERDMIARQYVNHFADIFTLGLTAYHRARQRQWSQSWSTSYIYMTFLATFPDSHVWRKFGIKTARYLRKQARDKYQALHSSTDPETLVPDWKQFDHRLKDQGINPGSSADLTVTTLLIAQLHDICCRKYPPSS